MFGVPGIATAAGTIVFSFIGLAAVATAVRRPADLQHIAAVEMPRFLDPRDLLAEDDHGVLDEHPSGCSSAGAISATSQPWSRKAST